MGGAGARRYRQPGRADKDGAMRVDSVQQRCRWHQTTAFERILDTNGNVGNEEKNTVVEKFPNFAIFLFRKWLII